VVIVSDASDYQEVRERTRRRGGWAMTSGLPAHPRCSWCSGDVLNLFRAPCARCRVALERLHDPAVSVVDTDGQVIRWRTGRSTPTTTASSVGKPASIVRMN